jgi:hypothetical protein
VGCLGYRVTSTSGAERDNHWQVEARSSQPLSGNIDYKIVDQASIHALAVDRVYDTGGHRTTSLIYSMVCFIAKVSHLEIVQWLKMDDTY